jgi:hypothetical protein
MSGEIQDGNNTLTYVLPDVIDPAETICVTLRIPRNKFHIMAFKGAIWDLCNWWNWEKDDAHNGTKVAQVWRRVFRTMKFSECDQPGPTVPTDLDFGGDMADVCALIRWHNGVLEGYCECNGVFSWGPIPAIGTGQPTGGAGQPSGPQPQPGPGGGSQCYDVAFDAGGAGRLGVFVNTGDVITMLMDSGAGTNTPLGNWYCTDGSHFVLECVSGSASVTGAGPLPSANYGQMLAYIGGVYYPAQEGAIITVPSGVVNQPVTFLPNLSSGATAGSYKLNVCVQNNQATSYDHLFDFTTGLHGWVLSSGSEGGWVSGVGWVSDNSQGIHNEDQISIVITLPSGASVTAWSFTIASNGVNGPGSIVMCVLPSSCDTYGGITGTNVYSATHLPSSGQTFGGGGSVFGSPAVSGQYTIISARVRGGGSDPFAGL